MWSEQALNPRYPDFMSGALITPTRCLHIMYIYIYIYIYIYSDFSSVPRSFHVDQFTYHISLPSFKFHIFINL